MLTAKEEIPNPDPIFIIVSCHRFTFVGISCKEEIGRIVIGWKGRYYGPLVFVLPVIPVRGPDKVSYNLQGKQLIIRCWRMMKIAMSSHILPRKEKKLLVPTPLTYPGVSSMRPDNTSSNRKIDLRGSDRSGGIDCVYGN